MRRKHLFKETSINCESLDKKVTFFYRVGTKGILMQFHMLPISDIVILNNHIEKED